MERGAQMPGREIDVLIEKTMLAMRATPAAD